MLSHLVSEQLNLNDSDIFYCDCRPDCATKLALPADAINMMMNDITLMLIIGNHESARAGDVVLEGEGFKVCESL